MQNSAQAYAQSFAYVSITPASPRGAARQTQTEGDPHMDRSHLKGRDSNGLNGVLAATDYKFSLFRRWPGSPVRALIAAVLRRLWVPPSACNYTQSEVFTGDRLLPAKSLSEVRSISCTQVSPTVAFAEQIWPQK